MRGIKPIDYDTEEQNIAIVSDALAHPIRKRIVDLLKENPGLTQKQLFQSLPLSKTAIFQHLNKLREAEIICFTYNVHYFPMTLNYNKIEELKDYLEKVLEKGI